MQRLMDKLVWMVVVSGVAGAIYATTPATERTAEVAPHGIVLGVAKHDSAHCSRCNNSEFRSATALRHAQN